MCADRNWRDYYTYTESLSYRQLQSRIATRRGYRDVHMYIRIRRVARRERTANNMRFMQPAVIGKIWQ